MPKNQVPQEEDEEKKFFTTIAFRVDSDTKGLINAGYLKWLPNQENPIKSTFSDFMREMSVNYCLEMTNEDA